MLHWGAEIQSHGIIVGSIMQVKIEPWHQVTTTDDGQYMSAILMDEDSAGRVADDSTLDGTVLEPVTALGPASVLAVGLPARLRQQHAGGRYFLARCGAQTMAERTENWQIYLRRPLFVCRMQSQLAEIDEETGFDRWDLVVPPGDDPGHVWLRARNPGETVNLIGPLGNGFSLGQGVRNLLVLTEPDRLALLLPVIDQMLDSNGRVTVAIRDQSGGNPTPLLALLPLAVEVHHVQSGEHWRQVLSETIAWADQICATLPHTDYAALAETIRQRRFRLESDFAHILVQAELACGIGACLACVVPTANGSVTRACVHGPVLDLARLAR